MIIDTAHRMGIETDLKESWALPIGVEAVNLLEMTGGYGVFSSGGYKAPPHAAIDIRTSKGDLLYKFDPGLENTLVINPVSIAQINGMLNSVVENGTAKHAQLPGIKVAGKTGTTNSYRDAWFMGFTGNFVGGVWYGNDNYQPSNKMTGGSLPAMTWQQVMTVAHHGAVVKPILGVPPFGPDAKPTAPEQPSTDPAQVAVILPPSGLSRGAAAALQDIETLIETAKETPRASLDQAIDPMAAPVKLARSMPRRAPKRDEDFRQVDAVLSGRYQIVD